MLILLEADCSLLVKLFGQRDQLVDEENYIGPFKLLTRNLE